MRPEILLQPDELVALAWTCTALAGYSGTATAAQRSATAT
jgi:hypothetical protein